MFGLTTTRRLRTELAAAQAEINRQRKRAEHAEERATTAEFNRKQILRQNAELDAVNQRLAKQITELADPEQEHATDLEQQLAAEKRRGDHLQRRLDDAMGLNTAPVLAGRRTGVRS